MNSIATLFLDKDTHMHSCSQLMEVLGIAELPHSTWDCSGAGVIPVGAGLRVMCTAYLCISKFSRAIANITYLCMCWEGYMLEIIYIRISKYHFRDT